jgi:E3 ubiquitin-protein ligase RNF139
VGALVFSYIHLGPRYPAIQRLWPVTFLAPSLLALLPLPTPVLHHAPVFAAILPLAMVKFVLWVSVFPVMQTLYSGYLYVRNLLR